MSMEMWKEFEHGPNYHRKDCGDRDDADDADFDTNLHPGIDRTNSDFTVHNANGQSRGPRVYLVQPSVIEDRPVFYLDESERQ